MTASARVLSAAAGGKTAGFDSSELLEHSITTVEEVAAFAWIRSKKANDGLQKLGVPKSYVDGTIAALRATKEGKAELADWDRFSVYQYSTGCLLDPDKEPQEMPGDAAVGPMGRSPVNLPTGARAPSLPSNSPLVSLIDAWMSPIRNQQNRGACVAFTATACLEYYQNRFCHQLGIDLSEQFVYWDMVTTSKGQHALAACYPLLKSNGACREATWPYYANELPGNDSQGPAPASALREAPAYRCRQALQLAAPRSVQAIKSSLDKARPVGIAIPVYDSWYSSPVVRKYGNITVPLAGEVPEKIGHAVTLVGYEDHAEFAGGGYFIVRNSWGQLWGTQSAFGSGYGTIPYKYIERFNWDAWCIRS